MTLAAVSEREFQDQVLELARLAGWLTYHTHDARRSAPGFPDLVLVRPPVIIFAELKSARGRLRPEQAAWLEALADCEGVVARLWRPQDWSEIERTLARTSGSKRGKREAVTQQRQPT